MYRDRRFLAKLSRATKEFFKGHLDSTLPNYSVKAIARDYAFKKVYSDLEKKVLGIRKN